MRAFYSMSNYILEYEINTNTLPIQQQQQQQQNDSTIIIIDRWYGSTLAYSLAGKLSLSSSSSSSNDTGTADIVASLPDEQFEWPRDLQLQPDLLLILDIDPQLREDRVPQRREQRILAILKRVTIRKGITYALNANVTADEVVQEAVSVIDPLRAEAMNNTLIENGKQTDKEITNHDKKLNNNIDSNDNIDLNNISDDGKRQMSWPFDPAEIPLSLKHVEGKFYQRYVSWDSMEVLAYCDELFTHQTKTDQLIRSALFEMNAGNDYHNPSFYSTKCHIARALATRITFGYQMQVAFLNKLKKSVDNNNDDDKQFLMQDFGNVIDEIEHTKIIVSKYERFMNGRLENDIELIDDLDGFKLAVEKIVKKKTTDVPQEDDDDDKTQNSDSSSNCRFEL